MSARTRIISINYMNEELITHLIELRKRLILILVGILITFFILSPFANTIYQYLSTPLLTYLPHNTQLIATDVTSPFFVPLKLTVILSIVISLPNTIFQVWQFIAPGLYRNEKRLIFTSIICGILLFIMGILFCYFIVLPSLFSFIGKIKADNIKMLTDIGKYLDFILELFLVFALTFQMPLIIYFFLHFEIVSLSKMVGFRKYMFVLCFIIAAIITPPDVISQILLAVPLYLLYELGILISKLNKRK